IPARHVPHEDADLTVVDLTAVATPLPFHPHRMPPPLREAAGIKGDHPIGFSQLHDDLSDQYLDQRTMIPRRGPDELLHDQALDIDEGCNLLGILAVQVGQQTRQVKVQITFEFIPIYGPRSLRGTEAPAMAGGQCTGAVPLPFLEITNVTVDEVQHLAPS